MAMKWIRVRSVSLTQYLPLPYFVSDDGRSRSMVLQVYGWICLKSRMSIMSLMWCLCMSMSMYVRTMYWRDIISTFHFTLKFRAFQALLTTGRQWQCAKSPQLPVFAWYASAYLKVTQKPTVVLQYHFSKHCNYFQGFIVYFRIPCLLHSTFTYYFHIDFSRRFLHTFIYYCGSSGFGVQYTFNVE